MAGAAAPPSEQTIVCLQRLLAERLSVDPAALDLDERLERFGLSSLTAAAVVAEISGRVGRDLPPTLIWDHPTLRRLAAFLDGVADDDLPPPVVPLAAGDAIAIVGLSCRFPGAASPAGFWDMLCAGTDAIREVPAERWPIDALYDPDPQSPGRMATRWGGFIDDVDRFDAGFFGMSPREAAQTDPQQRLALELAWEALEDAAIPSRRLGGSRTGVFIGAMWSDYARLLTQRDGIAQHTATGQDTSIISARIAYALGLAGPALTVNTACSSALVAVHQACRSLRAGESTLALAGGVHLLLAPESSIAMTKFGAMAPDGRCKAFDASANGYVRGEGGGLVVLKPLSTALDAGNRIYAVIRGGAINNDGASNGLTAPNPAAQRAMLRDALADARIEPGAVDYVEAHGTGTALGDPIEANALSAMLCRDRPCDRPLRLGSVKTNIGHLEAASGAAGLIKLALSLHHRRLPKSLHFCAPNPAIDFAAAKLRVQRETMSWPAGPGAPIGGVSSFGFGGTNCHLLLQAVAPRPAAAALAGASPVFVFCGNGGNWPGMAAGLAALPEFARSLQQSEATLAALGYPAPVSEVMTDRRVEDVALGQPALCAFQLAVADVLAGMGVRPAAVIGHSVGEAAAAAIAGILSRSEALRLVVVRSRLQARVAGEGAMALASAPAEMVERHLPKGVVVAGENGPRATLIAGAPDAVAGACRVLDAAGIVSQLIDVPVAYHSPQMDPLRPVLEAELADLTPRAGDVAMVSTVTGAALAGAALDAAYWGRNLREPVRFRQGIAALAGTGQHAFLEIAPHPLLEAQIRRMVPEALVVSPLRRGAADGAALHAALAPFAGERRGRTRHLLLLSARSPAALDELARRWADRLSAENWPDLCHTALVGRDRFSVRLALHAADGEEARRRLLSGAVLRGQAPANGLADFDQSRGPQEDLAAYLDRCAAAFVAGAAIDGTLFDAGEPWQVIDAPTYPFERERHWLTPPSEGLSYALSWEPFALPRRERVPALVAPPADPGLDAEAGEFARMALAAVPAEAIIPRHRALAARLAGWDAPAGGRAIDGPAAMLLRRVGGALPDLLTGRADPLEVLFPGGRLDEMAAAYDAPPFAAAQDALAAALAAQFAAGGRSQRVFELGAGTGGLTARLLAALPPGGELLASDVSEIFLIALRRRFGAAPGFGTALFDIDRPEGLDGPWDAIVAANVLHAGGNIAAILRSLRVRLAPGGVLGLAELVRAPRWIDLVFGITEGWWRFQGDDSRPNGALLDAAAWQTVLAEAGFGEIELRGDGDSHAVIVARAEAVSPRIHRPAAGLLARQIEELEAAITPESPLSLVLGSGVGDAALSGAARALSLQHPTAVAATFELADDGAASLAALKRALGRTGAEDQLCIREGKLSVARLVRESPSGEMQPIARDRLYVVAGGLGRLGLAAARFLVARGARHLLLVGRSSADPGRLAMLAGGGVAARYLQLDLTTQGAAAVLAAAFDRKLGGVVHAAGVYEGSAAQILAAKLDVAATLETAIAGGAADFLLLFSSAAGIWGSRGHVAYAAANRALDRWAEEARNRNVPATAIAFGRFDGPGFLPVAEDAALESAGLLAMNPDAAFAAALHAVAEGVPHRIVAAIDWRLFRETFEARRRRPLFDRVAPLPAPTLAPLRPAGGASPDRLDRDGMTALIAELMGHGDSGRLNPDRGLFEQGLDSLMTVELRRRIEEASGIAVPTAVLFAHPTVTMLAEWLAGHARLVPSAEPQVGPRHEKIAIIGLGCRFPGGVTRPEELHALLLSGREAIGDVPSDRPTAALWDAAGTMLATRRGGFLQAVERFDAAFFGISPREAAQLDPQQRLLLEVAWEALENAGIAPDRLAGTHGSVFVGATGSDYAALARAAGPASLDAHSLIGQPSNTLAGRLAYQFGLHGPALTVDTACSSSLVALHLAVGALRRGEAELALAGGVNLMLTPDTSVMLSRAGLLSPGGRCKTFDAAADGYVRGEGVGVAVLKPLSSALRDGDRVLAIIAGSAVNHDGRSSSFTAPNGAAQAAVIRDALGDAGLGPRDIDYVEAHGTGTSLGDPIELDALAEVFAEREVPLVVGSVKAAIGHTEAAAGIAAVIKSVLCLASGTVPPQANFTHLNPRARTGVPIEIAGAGARPPAELRRIGVSAFGASGTNAHVVLEGYADRAPERGDGPPHLLLSAATPESLDILRQRILASLSEPGVEFADICHTAWVGRARLPFWLLAGSAADLAEAPIRTGAPPDLATPRGRRVALTPTAFEPLPHWLGSTPAPAPEPMPLLGEPRRSARSGEETRNGRLDPNVPWLHDHVVDGALLLPAAAFLAMAFASGMRALADVEFHRRLEVPPDGLAVQLVRDRDGAVALYAEASDGWTEIATARVAGDAAIFSFPDRPREDATIVAAEEIADELVARGFRLGPTYRVLRRLKRDARAAEAEIAGFHATFSPVLLDSGFQILTALLPPTATPWLPARIARATIVGEPSGKLSARARLVDRDPERAVGDAVLESPDGMPVVVLEGIELLPAPIEPGAWLYDVVWRRAALTQFLPEGQWHAIGPGAASLGLAGFDEDGTVALPPADGIVDLRPLAAATPQDCIAATAALVREAARLTRPPQIVLLSRGASAAPPVLGHAVPAAAVLMGLQPVIEREHPELRCRWLDLDPDNPAIPVAFAGAAGRYALRHGQLLMPTIVKAVDPPSGEVRVIAGPEHSFTDLRVVASTAPPPGPGEVRIEVAAAGLNFKDVLAVLGRAPGPEQPLGLECAGEIVDVGAGVTDLAPGDRVLAFGRGALASRVTLPAGQVLRRPDWLDEDGAASLPVAALTGWHGLHDLAAIRPGMRVLVHAGAGGVGATAIGLARLAGARVFATASAGKELAAAAAGAEAVADSRSTGFAAAARAWAGPDGFDAVLNALGPEIAAVSAALLRPGGVFLEIGTAPAPIGARPFRHVAYTLDAPLAADPGWFADRMTQILALIRDGRLAAPRRTVLPLAQAEEALRALGQGGTIGKIVLRLPRSPRLRSDGVYLITGGTGAVGRALARELTRQGAGRVILAARRPVADPDFETIAVDVADAAALAAALTRLPRLDGVIHAAGVVRDRTLAGLGATDIADVIAAKVTGAANLDALTHDRKLDFFILVSSTAGSLAAPGQGAYAAANAWLDRLAAARRANGLPAMAIGSGPWRGGMFARLDAPLRQRLERDGFRPMAPSRAAAAFLRALGHGTAHRLVMDLAPVERPDATDGSGILGALLVASGSERRRLVRAELSCRLVAQLGLPAGTRLDPSRALRDLGLDSLLSISLRNELSAVFEVDLPSTLLFDHPTLDALTGYLLDSLAAPEPSLETLDEGELARLLEHELGAAAS